MNLPPIKIVGNRTFGCAALIIVLALCQKFLGLQVDQKYFDALIALAIIFQRLAVTNALQSKPDTQPQTPEKPQ